MGYHNRGSIFSCFTASLLSILLVLCEIRDNTVTGELTKRQTSCGPTEYQCTGIEYYFSLYRRCIDAYRVCDTHNDCTSGSDELNCPTDCTGPHQFKCQSDGKCIPIRRRCDGHNDCTDHSDEAYCSSYRCPFGSLKCDNNLGCFKKEYKCDGDYECSDWSDEKGCKTGQCSDYQFECKDGSRCISLRWKCDSDKDCKDGSDEMNCNCSASDFHCGEGGTTNCIGHRYLCDGNDDCGNGKDESADQCHGNVAEGTCSDLMNYESCYFMNTTVHAICTIHADAHKLCRKFCNLCGNGSS